MIFLQDIGKYADGQATDAFHTFSSTPRRNREHELKTRTSADKTKGIQQIY